MVEGSAFGRLLKFGDASDKKSAEIIAVTSGKGGVGKTNLSVNLSLLLSQFGKRVLLIDADIHLGNIDLFLGINPDYNISDFILNQKPIEEIIFKCPQGIDLLPASSVVKELIESEDEVLRKISAEFKKIQHKYDTIVIDTGAGVSRTVLSFVLSADKVIVIATPDPASIADTYGIVKIVKTTEPNMPIILVVNMVKNQEEGDSLFRKLDLMAQKFLNSKLIYGGYLVDDEQIARAIKIQSPFILEYPNSISTLHFKIIVKKLMSIPIMDRRFGINVFDRLIDNKEIILGRE
ncbi:MAG: AAA family ATPase [Candidatus Marinimicrobia bacterium]|nr:AAA family ATPase [Candidatus Neomarinimicrobiota bacterium]